jgi:amidohydrolase
MTAARDAEITAVVDGLQARLVETRRDIHRHPELGNREVRTGQLVADRLLRAGLEVRHPVAKTGVVGILRGARPHPVVALRADLDALPINETLAVPYSSLVPDVKHACGHDAHTAIALGVAETLAVLRESFPGTLLALFQPAEEGLPEGEDGGAALMIREGALDDPAPEAVFGLHVDPTLEVGTVGWTAGPIFAAADTFRLEVRGTSTHGAYPHTGVDPIPVAAGIVLALQSLVARQLDALSPKVLSIGEIHGGKRFNIVADSVVMRGTLRTLSERVRREAKAGMARIARALAEAHGAEAELHFRPDANPATVNDAALALAARPSLERSLGPGRVIEVAPQMGAEDFAFFAERVPSLYLKLGVRNEARGITAMIHTQDFDLDETALPIGVRAMTQLLWDYASGAIKAR